MNFYYNKIYRYIQYIQYILVINLLQISTRNKIQVFRKYTVFVSSIINDFYLF